MQLRPSTAPVDDPFFAPVRRRHPDVDVVVLPVPPPPEGVPSDPADGTDGTDTTDPTALLARVEAVARGWWGLLAQRYPVSDEVGAEPRAGFRFGPEEHQVRATARVTTRLADGEAALADLRDALAGDGWMVERPPGDVPRVTAALDDLVLTASHAPGSGAFLLSVSSASVSVGVVTARDLVAGDPGTPGTPGDPGAPGATGATGATGGQ